MPREIRFGKDDFEQFFAANGVDFDSLSDYEWSKFENMFVDGTSWTDVAETAAFEIARMRKEAND